MELRYEVVTSKRDPKNYKLMGFLGGYKVTKKDLVMVAPVLGNWMRCNNFLKGSGSLEVCAKLLIIESNNRARLHMLVRLKRKFDVYRKGAEAREVARFSLA